jgi:hypothetical protein
MECCLNDSVVFAHQNAEFRTIVVQNLEYIPNKTIVTERNDRAYQPSGVDTIRQSPLRQPTSGKPNQCLQPLGKSIPVGAISRTTNQARWRRASSADWKIIGCAVKASEGAAFS